MIFSFAKKHQKFSAAILFACFMFLVLGGAFLPLSQARGEVDPSSSAANLTSKAADVAFGWVLAPITAVLYAIQYILGLIIKLELVILSWVFNTLSWNNSTVEDGWNIVRDVANLFFIIVIMIIAFATVLQMETYGMKALLPKLILIALLINFSLVICGFLIDFSNAFGNTFKNTYQSGAALSMSIASVLQTEKVNTQQDQTFWEKLKDKGAALVNAFSFTAFFTTALNVLAQMIMAFVIAAGIFFMAVRQVSLMIIVILSPMALICLLLPFLNSYWNQWKEAFTKWTIFYPIYMFFLYLGLKILTSGEAITGAGLPSAAEGVSDMTAAKVLWKVFIASMFLCGAIVVAQKMSVAGAGAIGKFGTSALKTVTGAGAAIRAGRAVKERAKEEAILRRSQLASRLAPTATMRREAELRAKGIEKKREKDFARLVEHKTDPTTGKAVLTDKGKYLAEKYANNPTSRYHKMSVKALAGKWEPSKPKPLTAEDIERLEKKLSEKKS